MKWISIWWWDHCLLIASDLTVYPASGIWRWGHMDYSSAVCFMIDKLRRDGPCPFSFSRRFFLSWFICFGFFFVVVFCCFAPPPSPPDAVKEFRRFDELLDLLGVVSICLTCVTSSFPSVVLPFVATDVIRWGFFFVPPCCRIVVHFKTGRLASVSWHYPLRAGTACLPSDFRAVTEQSLPDLQRIRPSGVTTSTPLVFLCLKSLKWRKKWAKNRRKRRRWGRWPAQFGVAIDVDRLPAPIQRT